MTNAAPGKGRTALSNKLNLDSAIVTQNTSNNQLFLKYICRRHLSDALELLKERSYSCNTAIFMLAYCQKEAV